MQIKNKKDNKVKETRLTVKITKRIQEENFEPFEITLEDSIVFSTIKNKSRTRRIMYNDLEKEINHLINKRII